MKRPGMYIFLALLMACSSKDPVPAITVSDYFPLKIGAFQIYTIDSVSITQNVSTAYSYQLKTQVTGTFPNPTGGVTYTIQRSRRANSSAPWTAQESWSARVTDFQAIVNEGNIPYVKIASPLINGTTWDGNALNTLGGSEKCIGSSSYTCDIYTLANFEKSYTTAADTLFANTLTVIENDNEDPIVSQDIRQEVYALNIGLISREMVELTFCTDPDCLGTQFVTSGVRYQQTIASYGGF
jgi:hypothetical protein